MTEFTDTLDRFRLTVAGPPDAVPLARSALLVAQAEYPALDIDAYDEALRALGARVEARIHPAMDVRAQLDEAHRVLFEEEQYRGNEEQYADPRNLYLNDVVERRL